jgi:hypothetical protein
MELQLGNIYQDAAWIVSEVVRVIGGSAHDGLVQGDFPVISPIRDRHRPALRWLILNLVQVIDHQLIIGSPGRKEFSDNAIPMPIHRIVSVG